MGAHLAAALLFVTAIQPSSGDAIARQLHSTDPRTVAWGAYNAGAYQRGELIPRLQRVLEAPPTAEAGEQRALEAVVMDALIQLNARLPARVLVPHTAQRPVQAFVLLSKATHRERVLLDLLPQLSGFRWFAAANMLFEDRSPGLAAYLVRTVRLRLTVSVAESDSVGFGSGGSGPIGVGCGIGQDPPGYPPHAEYRFELEARPGLLVLATGPRNVYYSRAVTTSFQYPVSELTTAGPNDEDRMEYLRAMSADIGIRFRAHTEVTVRWSTADALLQRVRQLRAEVEQRFRSIVERARQFYPVPPSVVVQPRVEVHLVDRRVDTAVPLPKIGR